MVTPEMGESFAKSNGLLFYETSALTGDHVNEAFEHLVKHILQDKNVPVHVHKESVNEAISPDADQRAQEMQAELHVSLEKPEKNAGNKKQCC